MDLLSHLQRTPRTETPSQLILAVHLGPRGVLLKTPLAATVYAGRNTVFTTRLTLYHPLYYNKQTLYYPCYYSASQNNSS